jgi:hypothetical protein
MTLKNTVRYTLKIDNLKKKHFKKIGKLGKQEPRMTSKHWHSAQGKNITLDGRVEGRIFGFLVEI